MTISSPKLIAFDIDNTLIFGPEAEAFYAQYGRALERSFAQELSLNIDQARTCLNAFRHAYDGRGELAFDAFNLPQTLVYDAICSVCPTGALPRMEKTIALLTQLKERTRIVAITDGPVEQARRLLEQTGIPPEWFVEIIAWERGKERPKNRSSRVFEDVCARYQVLPRDFAMVGDSYTVDIEPAQRLGAQTVHIGNRPESIPDISFMNLT